MGIFGTFLGIFGGLLKFDTQNIDASIPILLGGLKTAFLTSIAGSLASLLIKIWPKVYRLNDDKNDPEKDQFVLMRQELEKIVKSLSGDEETTLLTQIQKLRTSMTDKQDELKQAFDRFAQQMAENNINALIEAVNKVMEDFNAKINNQLGESFRELSDSVKNLVEWQKNYRSIIESSIEALGVIRESLKNSSESLSNTSDKVFQIAESNQRIERLNHEFKSVIEKLNQMLGSTLEFSQAMKSLSNELSGSGEIIRNETRNIVESSIKNLGSHAEETIRNINSITETSLNNMRDQNNKVLKNFEEINMKTLSAFGENLASISGKLTEDFKKIQEALSTK